MKNLVYLTLLLMVSPGCGQLDDDLITQQPTTRVVPKSYEAPTPNLLASDIGWRFEGRVDIDGATQTGKATEFVGYDTFMTEGTEVTLNGWSSGWASLTVFAAPSGSESWQEMGTATLSTPVNGQVEAGENTFVAPFSGQYLILIGPVMNDEIEYLLRLDCDDGCDGD